MRMLTKKLAWCTAMLLVALALAACGARDAGGQGSPVSGAPADSSSVQEEQEPEFRTGTFNGLSDGHTIEIETENGPQAFQISHEIFKKAKLWEPGAKVRYKAEGLTITEIDLE